jgi:hypothetical protein
MPKFWIHKHSVSLEYGGPEEGGWWYTAGIPTDFALGPITDEEDAYEQCRNLNHLERERQEREEQYNFTSVLAKMSVHYEYSVEEFATPRAFPEARPHYE